jgi:PAS domain S-box-containing protein
MRAPRQTRGETHRQTARGCGHDRSFHDAHETCSAWILDAVPDGFLSIDPHGRVLSINRQAERLLGYRREELVGQSISKVFSVWPDTRGVVSQVAGRHSDGSTVPFDVRLSPPCSAHGVRTVLVARASTRATGESRDLASDILETAADPIWVVDALALRLTYANTGLLRRLGYDDYEVLGRPIGFIAPELADGGFGRRWAQLGGGTPSSLVHPHVPAMLRRCQHRRRSAHARSVRSRGRCGSRPERVREHRAGAEHARRDNGGTAARRHGPAACR